MQAYIAEELIWAIAREREEEVRKIRPHTERRTEDAHMPPPEDRERPTWRHLQPCLDCP
jgi:hypothetical protein